MILFWQIIVYLQGWKIRVTVAMMSLVEIAKCCTPGPWLKSRYSSICDFFFPLAGSLIGYLGSFEFVFVKTG